MLLIIFNVWNVFSWNIPTITVPWVCRIIIYNLCYSVFCRRLILYAIIYILLYSAEFIQVIILLVWFFKLYCGFCSFCFIFIRRRCFFFFFFFLKKTFFVFTIPLFFFSLSVVVCRPFIEVRTSSLCKLSRYYCCVQCGYSSIVIDISNCYYNISMFICS